MKEAAALWIKRCNEKGLEPMTVKGYEEHVNLHIVPFIGAKKASEMTVPAINAFADQLREAGRSAEMIKRVVRSVGSIFKELRRRGLATTAPTSGIELDLPERDDPRPVIPTKAELQAVIAGAVDRWRPSSYPCCHFLRAARQRAPGALLGQRRPRRKADKSHPAGRRVPPYRQTEI